MEQDNYSKQNGQGAENDDFDGEGYIEHVVFFDYPLASNALPCEDYDASALLPSQSVDLDAKK